MSGRRRMMMRAKEQWLSVLTDTIRHNRYQAWINTNNRWITSSDNSYTIRLSVTTGAIYKLTWDSVDASEVASIFRFGFCSASTPSAGGRAMTDVQRTSPQATPEAVVTASNANLIVQVSGDADEEVVHGYLSHLQIYKKV